MSDAIKGPDGCRYDAKENLDLSQTPDAFKSIVQNQCPPTLKPPKDNALQAPKKVAVPSNSIPQLKTSDKVDSSVDDKTRKELESFSEANSATYEALKNIEKTFGVPLVQNFERAKYEAKLNGVSSANNNAFVKGFLREYAVQMYKESKSTSDYSNQIGAGRAAAGLPPLVHKNIDADSYYSVPLPVIKKQDVSF